MLVKLLLTALQLWGDVSDALHDFDRLETTSEAGYVCVCMYVYRDIHISISTQGCSGACGGKACDQLQVEEHTDKVAAEALLPQSDYWRDLRTRSVQSWIVVLQGLWKQRWHTCTCRHNS